MKKLLSLSLVLALSGCVSIYSPEEVFGNLEHTMEKNKVEQVKPKSKIFYRQPRNKNIKCLIPVSKIDKSIDIYWDGECRDGYAYGLGREINISESVHIDYITRYSQDKKSKITPIIEINYMEDSMIKGGYWGKASDNRKIATLYTFDPNRTHLNGAIRYESPEANQMLLKAGTGRIFIINSQYGVTDARFLQISNTPEAPARVEFSCLDEDFPQAIRGKLSGIALVTYQDGVVRYESIPSRQNVIVGKNSYMLKAQERLTKAQQNLTQDTRIIDKSLKQYLLNLKRGVFKKPTGLTDEIYYEIYDQVEKFVNLERELQVNEMEQLKLKLHQESVQEARRQAAGYTALKNQLSSMNTGLESGINSMQGNLSNPKQFHVPPMQTPGSSINIHRTKKLNDQIFSDQQLK